MRNKDNNNKFNNSKSNVTEKKGKTEEKGKNYYQDVQNHKMNMDNNQENN